MKKNSRATLIAIIAALFLVGGTYAITRFLYEKTANVEVISNAWNVKIVDSGDAEITAVDFPDIVYGDYQGSESTTEVYTLVAVDPGTETVYCYWNVLNLPGGMTVTAERYTGGAWEEWTEDTEAIELTSTTLEEDIRFTIDTGSNYVAAYAFTIEVNAGDA